MTVQDQRTFRDSAPSNGVVALSSGAAYTGAAPIRAVFLNCTVAAAVTVVFFDSSSATFSVPAGLYEFNWRVTTITTNSGTITYYGLV